MKRIPTESTTETNNDTDRMLLIKKQNKKLSELQNLIESQEQEINKLQEEKEEFENLQNKLKINEQNIFKK